jgi:hypothetical protein
MLHTKVTKRDAPLFRERCKVATTFTVLNRYANLAKAHEFYEQIADVVEERDRDLRGLNGLVYWTNGAHTVPVEGGYWTCNANNKRVFVKATDLCEMHGYELAVQDD